MQQLAAPPRPRPAHPTPQILNLQVQDALGKAVLLLGTSDGFYAPA